jgi:hypothetical protein
MHIVLDRATLDELETVIEDGLQTFVDVGLALMEVRDRRLYRESGYPTFEKYCVGRWNFKRHYAHRLIDSAMTMKALVGSGLDDNMLPIGNAPSNEAQTRELAPLAKSEPEAARAVWREVVDEAETTGEPVTAAKVRAAVQRQCFDDDWNESAIERVVGEPLPEPDPRISDLTVAIQLLEPLYRDYDDELHSPQLRAHTAALRNILNQMRANT